MRGSGVGSTGKAYPLLEVANMTPRIVYSNLRSHKTWEQIIQRCYNPKMKCFSSYGGRGITVCDRWRSFANFLADMGEKPDGLTIERIDNEKGYTPDNCRWATRTDQARNRRTSLYLTAFGETKTVAEWSEDARCAVKRAAIYQRLERGWDAESAISTINTPPLSGKRVKGQVVRVTAQKQYGSPESTLITVRSMA